MLALAFTIIFFGSIGLSIYQNQILMALFIFLILPIGLVPVFNDFKKQCHKNIEQGKDPSSDLFCHATYFNPKALKEKKEHYENR